MAPIERAERASISPEKVSKSFVLDLNVVDAEWNVAGGEASRRVGGIVTVELSDVAGKFDGAFDAEAVRAGDFEAEFSTVALRQERDGA
jgi:hypothetical protein